MNDIDRPWLIGGLALGTETSVITAHSRGSCLLTVLGFSWFFLVFLGLRGQMEISLVHRS